MATTVIKQAYPKRIFNKNGVDSFVVKDPAQEQALKDRDPGCWFNEMQPKPYVAPKPDPLSPLELTNRQLSLESKLADLEEVVSELMAKVETQTARTSKR